MFLGKQERQKIRYILRCFVRASLIKFITANRRKPFLDTGPVRCHMQAGIRTMDLQANAQLFPHYGVTLHQVHDAYFEEEVGSTLRSPVPASLHLLALQLKPSIPGLRAQERRLFTPSVFLVLLQATQRHCEGALATPPFVVGPFCRSVGAQYTTQPWRADPLTPPTNQPSYSAIIYVYIYIYNGS